MLKFFRRSHNMTLTKFIGNVEETAKDVNLLLDCLKPVLYGLKVGGIGPPSTGKYKVVYSIYSIFTLTIILVALCCVVSAISPTRNFDAAFVATICLAAWNTQATFSACYALYIFRGGHFARLLNLFDELNLANLINKQAKQRIKTLSIIGAIACCFYSSISFVLVSLTCFPSVMRNLVNDSGTTLPYSDLNFVIWVSVLWSTIAWVLVSILYCLLGIIAASAVHGLNHDMTTASSLKHAICKLTANFDNVMKFIDFLDNGMKWKIFCAVVLTVNVPVMVSQIYILLIEGSGTGAVLRIQMGIWAVGQFIQIFLLCSSALIHQEGSCLYTSLYGQYASIIISSNNPTAITEQSQVGIVKDNSVDDVTYHRVHILLNQLAHTSVGFTVWDLFVINKSTILTMLSVVVTYFLLLVEFTSGNPAVPAAVACNCTKT